MSTEEMALIAQNLARNCGFCVFPVLEDKRPATPHGFHDASKDPDVIPELWIRYPGPLIGIATGEKSGVDVLDIDVKHEVATKWWDVASKRVPPTRIYRTRSGGLHIYFQHAAGIGCTQAKLALGIDSRGDRGYAIFWFASGFECLDHSAPALWPTWLRDCLLWQPPKVAIPSTAVSSRHADKAIEGVLRHLSTAKEGERNAILFWGACRLRERVEAGQMGQAEAQALLANSARAAGLQDFEAQRTITSAWRGAA
jgi:hypothetical protein